MHKFLTAFSALALVAAPSVAQDTTAGSALTIRTTDTNVARSALRMFESSAELPTPGDGGCIVLSLDDGGQMTARAGEGSNWLQIDADPSILMQIFAPQIQQARGMAQMVGGMQLAQAGMDFETVNKVVGAVFEFPNQIGALRITMPKEANPENGVDLTVDMTPVADTWFDKLVKNAKQTGQGIPTIDAASPLATMFLDVDLTALETQLQPLMDFGMAFMGATGEGEDAEAMKTMSRQMTQQWVGTAMMTWDASNGMRALSGVKDSAKLAEMMDDPLYEKIAKASGEMAGNAEVEFTRAAFEHRGVKVVSNKVIYDDPSQMPLSEDGTMQQYVAAAGNTMVMTMFGGGKDAISGLIDLALDEQAKRTKLPKGTMMTVGLNMAEMLDTMSQSGQVPPGAADEAPEKVDISLSKGGNKLTLKVFAK